MATVCVKGVGKIKKAPDTAEINVRMERFDADYGKSSEKCAQATETLKTALKAAGFKESALKTASFSVSAKYENVPDKGAYKSVLTGFNCLHMLKMRVPAKGESVQKALSAILSSGAECGISLAYTLSDKEKAVEKMLAAAYVDAEKKAEALISAAGKAKGALVSITEGSVSSGLYSRTDANLSVFAAARSVKAVPEFNAEDIEDSVTVTAEWEIV